MFVGILFVIGGFILAKYGIAAILGGLGAIAIALGLKKDS